MVGVDVGGLDLHHAAELLGRIGFAAEMGQRLGTAEQGIDASGLLAQHVHEVLQRLGVLALVGKAAGVERADLDEFGVVAERLAVAPCGAGQVSLLLEAACHGKHGVRGALDEFLRLVEGIAGIVMAAHRGQETDAAGVRLVALAVERHGLLHERERGGGVAFQLIDGGGRQQRLRGVRIQFMATEVFLAGFFRTVGLLQQASEVEVPVRSIGIADERLAKGGLGFGQPAVLVVATGLLGQFVSVTPFAVRFCHDG